MSKSKPSLSSLADVAYNACRDAYYAKPKDVVRCRTERDDVLFRLMKFLGKWYGLREGAFCHDTDVADFEYAFMNYMKFNHEATGLTLLGRGFPEPCIAAIRAMGDFMEDAVLGKLGFEESKERWAHCYPVADEVSTKAPVREPFDQAAFDGTCEVLGALRLQKGIASGASR